MTESTEEEDAAPPSPPLEPNFISRPELLGILYEYDQVLLIKLYLNIRKLFALSIYFLMFSS